jgi:hypothetical protein
MPWSIRAPARIVWEERYRVSMGGGMAFIREVARGVIIWRG